MAKTGPLPPDHRPYTDKYFLRTRRILQKENIDPRVSMKVFARGEGPVAGMEEAVAILREYSDLERRQGRVWVIAKERFTHKEPLVVIEGPVQSIVELETMYLGVLSAAISGALGIPAPQPAAVTAHMKELRRIYGEIPIIYFGARHYHWSLDKDIAAAALQGGAVQTSTDVGSAAVGLEGVGTTPHLLAIVLAYYYGIERATLKTAELFDTHIAPEVPRVTLVDTFNREVSDSLAVARYFGDRKHALRIDTCGENIGEGCSVYRGTKTADPGFIAGTGVTVELVTQVREALIEAGFGDSAEIFLSSGFGNKAKARAFVRAHQEFKARTGYGLFSGVGIGEVSPARFCTADLFRVEGRPLAKTGREVEHIDYGAMKRVI